MPRVGPTPDSATTNATAWIGWYRRQGEQWQPVVNGSTYDEAWQALHDAADQAGQNCDLVVLRVGVAP
jgi:hypothetical protein